MNKKNGKFFAIVMVAVMTLSMTACGGNPFIEEDETGDETKTVINVSNYDAGYGSDWLEESALQFEKLYEGKSFETGKLGVDVVVHKDKSIGTDISSSIAYDKKDIYLSEQFYYSEYAANGLVAKIDDVLTTSYPEFDNGKTLISKMPNTVKTQYQYIDGSYYALPTYFSSVMIHYNRDLFDQYKLYFAKDGGFVKSLDAVKSLGADGIEGTYDDGLPATYEEFYTLCDKMLTYKITPLNWGNKTYLNALLTSLQADYEGVDDTSLCFAFDGTAKNLVKQIKDDGTPVLEEKEIKPANGYDIYRQAGRYHALNFIETCIDRGYVNAASLSSTTAYSYTAAQTDFVMSGIAGKKKIGMLVEGVWWEKEAASIFQELVDYYGDQYSRENKNFAVMPMPKATAEQVGKGNTFISALAPGAIINAKTTGAQLEVAKLFFRYLYSDEHMQRFSKNTGVPMVFDYEIDVSQSNTYAKSLKSILGDMNVVFPVSSSPLYLNNINYFNVWFSWWNTLVDGTSYKDMTPIIDNKVTAKEYFIGIYNAHQVAWASTFKDYI